MINFPSVLESINDLNIDQINGLLSLADKFHHLNTGLPFKDRRPIIATSFLENSTRTKHSFAIAIHRLGATYIDFNAETSSLKKGESLEETLLTLNCQGVDLCVIRTDVSHALSALKKNPPIKVINGGDGTHEHPTQALLDLFTMSSLGLELKNKTITIIGDCRHSRVGTSLQHLLPHFGLKIMMCGPEEFLPKKEERLPEITYTNDMNEAIAKADYFYLLRIQKERHQQKNPDLIHNYFTHYGLDLEKLKRSGRPRPVLHPGPANIGVEIGHDLMHSPYYLGYEQVKYSTAMRMAVIQAMILNSDKNIGKIHESKRLFS